MTTATAPIPAGPPVPGASWESDLLSALGAPVTPSNVQTLDLWAQSEGTTGSNNPLAISGSHQGAQSCIAQCGSSSPIYSYDTMANGVAATAQFLKGSNYRAVVAAFQQNRDPLTIWKAINASPWCKGCQNGFYPINLADSVLGTSNVQKIVGALKAGPGFGVNEVIPGPGSVGATVIGDVTGALLPSWLKGIPWHRVGMGAGGLLLMVAGAAIFLASTKPGETAIGAAEGIGALA